MTVSKGGNLNRNSAFIVNANITLNSSTSTLIAAENADRIGLIVYNIGNSDVVIKPQAASVDDDFVGIPLKRAQGNAQILPYVMGPHIITSEISAIAATDAPDVYVLEW